MTKFEINFDIWQFMQQELLAAMHIESCRVSLSFLSTSEIQQLNEQYRQKSAPTDVLSFPQFDFSESPLLGFESDNAIQVLKRIQHKLQTIELGDIIICLEIAEKQAGEIGQGIDREAAFLFVHGFLHLCGHDHQQPDEENLMLEQQRLLMNVLDKSSDATPLWKGCVNLKCGGSTARD